MDHITSLCPLLVVRGAARAIDFYQRALGAELLAAAALDARGRREGAELALGGARFCVLEEPQCWHDEALAGPGRSVTALLLGGADAAARIRALRAAGASRALPLRGAAAAALNVCVRDPFGQLWAAPHSVRPLPDELTPALAKEKPSIGAMSVGMQAPSPAEPRDPVGPGAPDEPRNAREPRIHLVIGPVGAGKSTFARRLVEERSALRLTLDDWMVTLFSPDRPEAGVLAWYRERAQRCIEQIWKLALQATARGDEVVLEIGLLGREERERIYERIAAAGLPLTVHVLDAAREVRRARVLARNHERGPTFSMVVPPEIFEFASDLWQPPESDECEGRDVRFLRTDPEA